MVKIIYEYNPSKLDNKLINIICKKIKISKIGENYDFKYQTQIYELKEIITKIFMFFIKLKIGGNLEIVGIMFINIMSN